MQGLTNKVQGYLTEDEKERVGLTMDRLHMRGESAFVRMCVLSKVEEVEDESNN